MIYLLLVLILMGAWWEARPLVQNRNWKELTLFTVLLAAGMAIIIVNYLILGQTFSVNSVIEILFKPANLAVKNFLLKI